MGIGRGLSGVVVAESSMNWASGGSSYTSILISYIWSMVKCEDSAGGEKDAPIGYFDVKVNFNR